MHIDTPRGVRPYGRTGAAALAALSVLATGGVVLGTSSAAYASPANVATIYRGQIASAQVRAGASIVDFHGPRVGKATLAKVTQSAITIDKATVLSGQSIVVSGRVTFGTAATPVRNQAVRLEEATAGGWKTVGNALANADGSVTFTVKPNQSAKYRLNYAGIRSLSASVSEVAAVSVKAPAPVVVRTATSSSPSRATYAPASTGSIGANGRPGTGNGAAAVAAAAAQSGKPYIFGAAGPNAFDCSGLTMFVFAQFGVYLPHLADAQRGYGTAVAAADAAPGDLMIFLDGGYGYHAAIFAGGGMMYDAPNSNSTVGLHQVWSTNVIVRRLV